MDYYDSLVMAQRYLLNKQETWRIIGKIEGDET